MPGRAFDLVRTSRVCCDGVKPMEAMYAMNPTLTILAPQRPAQMPGPRDDESALVERLRAGDRAAFDQLVATHQRTLYAIVLRYVKNDSDAQDVVQATFVRAWRALPTFRGDASLKTWLYRIGVNQALNHQRGLKSRGTVEIPEHAASGDALPIERLAHAETQEQLLAAVDKLPAKQRMVVELRVQQGLSFKEVADVVDSTEDSAKANFHHALKKLRTLLSGMDGRA